MLQQRDRSTFLKQINPGPKLWLSLGLVLSNVLIKNTYYSIAILVFSIILIIKEKQLTLFKVIAISMVILFISEYALHGAISPYIDKANDVPLFNILGINYYKAGFDGATKYYLRFAPLMPALFCIFLTMDMADLAALMIKVKIPYKFVFTFIDSFQVIALLGKEMEQIKDAQLARGLKMDGNLMARLKAFVPIIVPVVATSIVKVQDQAIAMDTKGFNSKGKKTIYREIERLPLDLPVKLVGILMIVLTITYKVLISANVIAPFLTNIIV